MVKLNLPTRPWVPQWLGIVTMFIVIFPITLLNGAYTGSMVEVSNTLGVLSEDITMAYYSASVGMAVAYPIVPKIRTIATPKTLLLTDLLLQIFFSLVCAQTGSMDVIMVCSFCMGFLKAFVMLEFIILIRPLFSPKNVEVNSMPTSTPSFSPEVSYRWLSPLNWPITTNGSTCTILSPSSC